MVRKIVIACCAIVLAFCLVACGSSKGEIKTYEVPYSETDTIGLNVEQGYGIKVSVNAPVFSIKTKTGEVTGKVLSQEDIDKYLVEHYTDDDYFDCSVNGFTGFGYGGSAGGNVFQVISITDNAGVVLSAVSQDVLYDAETYVSFSNMSVK